MPNIVDGKCSAIDAKVISGCRFSAAMDKAQMQFARKLCFMPEDELYAVTESIKVGIRNGYIDDLTAMLCSVDPVLANLWLVWRNTVASEAWTAVLKTIFLHREGEV